MTTPTLIGLTGYAGTGKDTVRAILEQRGYIGLALADPIRQMLRELLTSNGIDDRFIDEREFKEVPIHELGVSYRQMAQTLGTEWGRACMGEEFWLRIAQAFIDDCKSDGERLFCISDVRFVNEARWVRAQGGVIWRIEREGVERVRAHASEAQVYSFDAQRVIANHGTPEQLNAAVLAALDPS